MDSFTERILERARERQRKLQEQNTGNEEKKITAEDSSKCVNLESSNSTSKDIEASKSLAKDNLDLKKPEIVRQSSVTKFSSDLPGSPKPQLKTLNFQNENFNMEIKLNSADNIRVEVEIEERDEDDHNSGSDNVEEKNSVDTSSLREDTRKRLDRLGKLFSGGDEVDISSPIHRTEEKFLADERNEYENKENNEDKPVRRGLGKLAALAENINKWEDDITPHKHVFEKNVSPKKNFLKFKANPTSQPKNVNKSDTDNNTKDSMSKVATQAVQWDQKVLKTLESQGFSRTQSNTKLVYNYQDKKENENNTNKIQCLTENIVEPKKVENEMTPRSPKKNLTSVANKAALFETNQSPKITTKDPALLSVSERKALFEQNKGAAPVPKVPFNLNLPQKTTSNAQAGHLNKKQQELKKNEVIKSKDVAVKSDHIEKEKIQSPKKMIKNIDQSNVSPTKVLSGAEGITRTVAALFEGKTTISQQQIESSVKEQRQKEMDLLLNRFKRNVENDEKKYELDNSDEEIDDEVDEKTAMIKEKKKPEVFKRPEVSPPSPPNATSPQKRLSVNDSPKVASVLEDVKRIKIVPPKEGRLYPCLSDIETATETETEVHSVSPTPNSSYTETSDSGSEVNTSFGRELLKQVCKNDVPQKRQIYDESTESDVSDFLNDMDDDYIDEAKNFAQSGPTPPKQLRSLSPEPNALSSHSFHYKSFTPTKGKSKDENVATHVVDGNDILPLTHTISFYRRQQTQNSTTPVRHIIRQPSLEDHAEEAEIIEEGVDKKIQNLLDEVSKQQTVISQTSQALNLCYSTPEFTGSTEQVEAEKVLLLSTHRRQAALHEIQRLKVEGTLRPKSRRNPGFHVEKGTLTISKVILPLKREYARALAATGGKGHHLICLVKCDEKVIPTKLVSTVAGSLKNLELELNIPGSVVIENVRGDFTVTFEVYCLQAHEEKMPHEVKYHIHKKQGKTTPKKNKCENRMIIPPRESPAGPQAVRSPTFALIGYVVLSIEAIDKKQWTLNKTPSMSPLEGTVFMTLSYKPQITVKHKGFLTMFEDVSGFGAWHRRWCLLNGESLVYWKYPDDEKKKEPISCIDLSNCITEKVGPVSREICARLNTFLIETERDVKPSDKESLVTIRKGNKTIIRNLLSADTKEERIEWCEAFNKALTALRLSKKTSK